MRGNKAGLGDLKRLHEQAQAQRRQQTEAARRAAETEAAAAAAPARTTARTTTRQGATLATKAVRAPVGKQESASPASPVATHTHHTDPSANAMDDAQALQRALRAVTPLRSPERVLHTPRRDPDAIPVQRRAAALGETPRRADAGVSDGDVTHLLSEGGSAYVRADAAPDTARKLRRGEWRAGAELDLHGLRVEQARHAVLSFIDECLEQGIRCVRIVHGKGYGSEGLTPVLKDKTRTWLVQRPDVLAFSQAPEREGGAGALLVLLRQTAEARR
jgi:DNA-nicking Smr family endonuclease